MALKLERLAVWGFKSLTPFSIKRYFTCRTYHTKRIRIYLGGTVAEMRSLEPFCILFLDSLPTIKRSFLRHKNCIVHKERGYGGGIVVIDCLIKLLNKRVKLLDYLWIDSLFFLGKGWQSKADCQSY